MKVKPIIDNTFRNFCKLPYPNHKRGCPNYGVRKTCPPNARYLHEILDLARPVYVVFNIFDFGNHVAKMKSRHPQWSDRQTANCLYWQGTARKQLKEKVREFLKDRRGLLPVYCPEACGVNVTATMAEIGEILEWPPKTKTYQVALVGTSIHLEPPND
jgi:hypothetical protein